MVLEGLENCPFILASN